MPRRLAPLVVFAAVALAAAIVTVSCGTGGPRHGSPRSTTSTSPPSTSAPSTTPPEPVASFDWWDPGSVAIGEDYVLGSCGGDGPFVCVTSMGVHVAVIEIASLALSSLPAVQEELALHGSVAALDVHAGAVTRAIATDRATGCGHGYDFRAEPAHHGVAPDGPVVRYGFTGALEGQPVTERTVQWAGVRDDSLVIVSLAAYDPAGCLTDDGLEASVGVHRELEPLIDAMVTAHGLPRVIATVMP